jgi:putative ABC transport system permease protein
MLSPRWRKVLRDLWLHKSRTTLVIVAIAIGIIGAGAVLNTWSILQRATREEYRQSNPPSATLRVDSIDAALLDRVRAMPAIKSAQARRLVLASVQTKGGWRSAAIFTMDDFTSKSVGVLQSISGSWPPGDGELVIESSSVEFAATEPGDSLRLSIGSDSSNVLPVTGIARDVGLAPGWMEHVVYGFATRETMRRIGAPSSLNELRIIVRENAFDRDAVRRTAFAVKTELESAGHVVSNVDVPVPGRHIHAGQIDSLLYIQGAFGLLALFLSGMLVFNLITAMLVGQVREIGVMKTLGARGSQIATMYLGLALMLGLFASAIALPIAAWIGRLYAEFIGNLLNFNAAGFEVPRNIFALQLVVGALLPVAAAAFPVIRGCRITVSEAIRDFGIDPGGARVSGRNLSRFSGLTRPLLLSLRNAFRRRQRMALTLLTLATGGAVYIGAHNLRASIRQSVDLLFSTQRFDMSLSFSKPASADSIESAARAVAGVSAAEAWSGARATFAHNDGTLGNSFPITGMPPSSSMVRFPVVSGRWLREGDGNALVVNRRLLDDEPVKIGSVVTVMLNGRRTRWTIAGIVESGPSAAAYAPRSAVAGIVSGGRATSVVVRSSMKGPASQLDLVERLRDGMTASGFDVRSSQLIEQQRHVIEDHLLMVADFLGVMSWLMIIVGGLGLASTMSLAVLERTREIGVLRAIGARHRSILGMLQIEGLVIALSSWAIALPLSIPMSVLLGKAFGRIMIRVPVTYLPEISGVLLWLVVAVVVSIIACLWPALRATRITTAAALAYE